jgi:hypothetical protein
LTLEFNLGWQREFFDKDHKAYPSKLAVPTASVEAFGAGKDIFLTRVNLFFGFYKKFVLEVSYDSQWNIRDHGFYGGFHT